jgi:hypothetical protein
MRSINWRDPRVIAGGAIVGILAVILLVVFMIRVGVTNDGNKKQQDLITYYNDTTNVLSDCLVKTKQSIGVTRAQTDALDKVITDAVRGRYTGDTTARPTGGALFSAIAEQYPNTDKLSETFGKVLVVINGCRSDFRDSQSILQRAATQFEQWRTGSFTVRNFGGGNYPTSALAITLNGETVSGKAAFAQMRKLVVVSDAQTGRDTGTIDNTDPFTTP